MPTNTINPSQTPVILFADREWAGGHDPALSHIAQTVRGNDVHVVAPASPLAGERWVVDVAAREEDARRRLESWTAALAPYASRLSVTRVLAA